MTELPLLIQNLDLDEIAKLPLECLDALIEYGNTVLNLRSQQRLHPAAGELRLQLIHRSGEDR